jgi:hypothetical protein
MSSCNPSACFPPVTGSYFYADLYQNSENVNVAELIIEGQKLNMTINSEQHRLAMITDECGPTQCNSLNHF